MRNVKALGWAVVMVFALSASAVSAASANQFHSGSSNTTGTVSGNGPQFFEYESGGQIVECSTIGGSVDATANTVTEVTFSPTYSGCQMTLILFTQVTVSMNGCDYLFTLEASANSGPAHIKCPSGKEISITVKAFGVSVCTYHIASQTPAGVSDYANSGTSKIHGTATQLEIAGTRQGAAECGAASSTQGSYLSEVEMKGEITGQQTGTNIQVG
jgi:hypothetical protein